MSRFPLVLLAGFVALASACSGDAKGGDDADGGAAGSASANAGSGGGGATPVATYTAAEACELFAQVSCDKAVECGLVLLRVATQLVCVQCDAASLSLIQSTCERDSPRDKDKAAVDRCVANISSQACQQACMSLDVPDCDAFGDLPAGTQAPDCDARCAG
jgi:hypothetical protein